MQCYVANCAYKHSALLLFAVAGPDDSPEAKALPAGAKKFEIRSCLHRFSMELVGCDTFSLAELGVENVTVTIECDEKRTALSCR